jgi:hypothetical protein
MKKTLGRSRCYPFIEQGLDFVQNRDRLFLPEVTDLRWIHILIRGTFLDSIKMFNVFQKGASDCVGMILDGAMGSDPSNKFISWSSPGEILLKQDRLRYLTG